ncbi:MAG: HAD-IIB family hydrolase [Burkholderiales bacterium]|nr:HAD-IIB family hydrolase [Burkholderiales bacterium]
MLPLSRWFPPARLTGVLTDIDDTLTTGGAITPEALAALGELKAAGLHLIPITGRPVGWSAPLAARWPVDAIVAENGACALLPRASSQNSPQRLRDERGQLLKIYQQSDATRARQYARMQQVLAEIEARVPGAHRARDSVGRECDIAIDHSEFTQLPQSAIDACVQIMRTAGMNATVSSIHINGWFGDHDKLQGARWIVRELLGRELDAELDRWVYVGDSTNDERMFEHFPHSVGVANIARFLPRLSHPPRYVTQHERGAGFAELARKILNEIRR